MGYKRRKTKSRKLSLEGSSEEASPTTDNVDVNTDNDDEANEDLSLKIVQKAMLRACTTTQNDAVFEESDGVVSIIDLSSHRTSASPEVEIVMNTASNGDADSVDIWKVQEKKVDNITQVIADLSETNPVEKADNSVLRKLLRGPRYFDPPDGSWGTCYNCGEDGHTTVNCTSAKRKKPCYVCGSLEHNAKRCAEAQNCFICKGLDHRAKDCPEKYKAASMSSKICLKCGNLGHHMFSCNNDYSNEDLKDIQCYVCKNFGHLCCVNYSDADPREVSCYRCGQAGHTGLACGRSRGETTGRDSLSTCYRCGDGGHFARECTNLIEVAKHSRSLSTPRKKLSKESNFSGFKTKPRDFSKTCDRKRNNYEERRLTTPSNIRKRGGWISDYPGDLYYSEIQYNGWNSPSTPIMKGKKTSSWSVRNHGSSSRSSQKNGKLYFENSATHSSARFYKNKFSASRFGNSGINGSEKNYNW